MKKKLLKKPQKKINAKNIHISNNNNPNPI